VNEGQAALDEEHSQEIQLEGNWLVDINVGAAPGADSAEIVSYPY
jgi:hypothetical protein